MTEIGVLDHGHVRLVDSMGSDLSISRAARVSYNAAWRAGEDEGSDAKLIRSLWRRGHTSPFEAVTISLDVKAPIFVFRQWHRHRTQSYNEISARYVELPEEFYVPRASDVGVQSLKSKQGRDVAGDLASDVGSLRSHELKVLSRHCQDAFVLYHDLLATDWPRELARMVLPLNTYSQMFATMNLLNLFRFLTLRADPQAQYEIRMYATAIIELVRPVAPIAVAAWENNHATL